MWPTDDRSFSRRRLNFSSNYSQKNMRQNVSFSGHETFPFRYGWLKKGVAAASGTPGFYSAPDEAMVELGVGKNMVNSIRHWCQAAGLLRSSRNSTTGRVEHLSTELADRLVGGGQYDPYFEDPATLWLVHWRIASNDEQCTTWYFLFNLFHKMEFTKEQLFVEIQKWLEKENMAGANENSLRRDIDVCLRTYVHARGNKRTAVEDTLDCPLTELNLIGMFDDGKTYKLVRGEQATLPDEIFLYALEEFWQRSAGSANSIPLAALIYEEGSPGQIFKLDENSIVHRLERIGKLSGGTFRYDETGSLKQLYRLKESAPISWLDAYYEKSSTANVQI